MSPYTLQSFPVESSKDEKVIGGGFLDSSEQPWFAGISIEAPKEGINSGTPSWEALITR